MLHKYFSIDQKSESETLGFNYFFFSVHEKIMEWFTNFQRDGYYIWKLFSMDNIVAGSDFSETRTNLSDLIASPPECHPGKGPCCVNLFGIHAIPSIIWSQQCAYIREMCFSYIKLYAQVTNKPFVQVYPGPVYKPSTHQTDELKSFMNDVNATFRHRDLICRAHDFTRQEIDDKDDMYLTLVNLGKSPLIFLFFENSHTDDKKSASHEVYRYNDLYGRKVVDSKERKLLRIEVLPGQMIIVDANVCMVRRLQDFTNPAKDVFLVETYFRLTSANYMKIALNNDRFSMEGRVPVAHDGRLPMHGFKRSGRVNKSLVEKANAWAASVFLPQYIIDDNGGKNFNLPERWTEATPGVHDYTFQSFRIIAWEL